VLREENPFTAQYLTTLGNGPLVTIPAGTGPTDLYLTGLAAFVYGDVVSAAIAWDAHAGMVRPSPFMEAALAEGDFIRRDWPLLYTRLDKAVQEFPDTAYLTVAFADAALHVGRIEEAGRLIALAQTQIPPDPSESHRRVLAEYLAARGDHAAAIEHFEFFRHRKRAPAAREAYGRYLLAQGRFLDAATIMHEVYIVQPLGRYGPLFHATANAWMQRADAAELEIARTGRLPGAPFAARMLADWQRLDEAGATAPFPALLIAPARSKADGSLPPPSEWWVQDMKRTDGSRTTR
jgi:tetratricopeptide (TPR) repeat protein